MTREDEIREKARRLQAEGEAFAARLAELRQSGDKAGALALLADVENAAEKAFAEISLLLGLTPAAVRLIREESERLSRTAIGGITEADLEDSKIGELLAGMRASRSIDGGEA